MQLGPALPSQSAAGLVPGDGAGPSGGGGSEAFATVLGAQAARGQPSPTKAGVHEGPSPRGDTSSRGSDGSDNTQTDELPALLATPILIALLTPIHSQGGDSAKPSADAAVGAVLPPGGAVAVSPAGAVASFSPAGAAATVLPADAAASISPAGAGESGPGPSLSVPSAVATAGDGAAPASPPQAAPGAPTSSPQAPPAPPASASQAPPAPPASASQAQPSPQSDQAATAKADTAPVPQVQAGQASPPTQAVVPDPAGINVVQDPRGLGGTPGVPKNGDVDARTTRQPVGSGNAPTFQALGQQAAKLGESVAFAASASDVSGQHVTPTPPQASQVASSSGGVGSQLGQGTSDSQLSQNDSGEASQTVLPGTSPSGVVGGSLSDISTEPVHTPQGSGAGGDLLGQLVAHAERMIPAGQSSVRVQLRPASLGTVDLSLSLKDGVLSLNIHTELTHTHDMIEAALPQLRHALSECGVDGAQVSLTSSSGSPPGDFAASGSWNGDQARGGEYYTPNRGYSVSVKEPSDVAQLTAVESLSGDHTIDYRV